MLKKNETIFGGRTTIYNYCAERGESGSDFDLIVVFLYERYFLTYKLSVNQSCDAEVAEDFGDALKTLLLYVILGNCSFSLENGSG